MGRERTTEIPFHQDQGGTLHSSGFKQDIPIIQLTKA